MGFIALRSEEGSFFVQPGEMEGEVATGCHKGPLVREFCWRGGPKLRESWWYFRGRRVVGEDVMFGRGAILGVVSDKRWHGLCLGNDSLSD